MKTPLTLRAWVIPILATPIALAAATAHAAATLQGEYFFNNTLSSNLLGAPDLTNIDPIAANTFETDTVFGDPRTVFHWDGNANPVTQQAGLTLNTSGLLTSNSYSIEMVFKFTDTTKNGAWRRVLDVHNRADDTGFYVNPSNALAVYPDAGITDNFTANTYRDVILTNDNGHAKGYLDGALEFTTSDTLMDIDSNNLLSFFLDNMTASGLYEFSDGSIALLRVYDGVLTGDEAADLAGDPFQTQVPEPPTPEVPEPASLGLLALGGLALLRHRK